MTEVEEKATKLAEAFRADIRFQEVVRDLDMVQSDPEISKALQGIDQNQRLCRKNEFDPRIKGPAIARIRVLKNQLLSDPIFVNFLSAFQDLEGLADTLISRIRGA